MSSQTRRTTSADGTSIAWEERGEGDPVLLIMGLGADRSAWRPHVESLEKSFRCVITDNRGAGGSGAPPGPYSTSVMADDHAAVVKAAGYGAVSVIGISLGGAIAQQLALRDPALVRKLILVSSWARCTPYSAENFHELKGLRRKLSSEDFTRRLQLLIWSPDGFDERVAQLREERTVSTESSMDHSAFAAQCEAAVSHDTSAQLHRISAPTLITAGTHDAFTPLPCSTRLARGIPDSQFETFEGRGHAHHWEDLNKFNSLCERFLHGQG